MMIKIAPSILSADFADFASAVRMLETAGADMVHCDVMDGVFVPNISFGQSTIKAIKRRTNLPLDVHLMITEPGRYVEEFAAAGADIITVHAESTAHLNRVVRQVKDCGKLAGVSLNPCTPTDVLKYVLEDIDLILCMSVNPGFGGQCFIRSTLDKLKEVRKLIDDSGRKIMLEVDGGVTPFNAPEIIRAGADVLVAGSAVFNSDDPAGVIKALRG
jgi:ribulose-phosphate 3-epimerase